MHKGGKQTQWRVRRNSWITEKPSASQRKASLSVHSLASRWMTEQEVWHNRCQEVSRTGTLPFWWWFLLQSHLCSCQEFMNRTYRSLVKYCLPLPNLLLLRLPSSTLECILLFSFLARVLFDHLNISLGLGWHLTGRIAWAWERHPGQLMVPSLRGHSAAETATCQAANQVMGRDDDASFLPWLRELQPESGWCTATQLWVTNVCETQLVKG